MVVTTMMMTATVFVRGMTAMIRPDKDDAWNDYAYD